MNFAQTKIGQLLINEAPLIVNGLSTFIPPVAFLAPIVNALIPTLKPETVTAVQTALTTHDSDYANEISQSAKALQPASSSSGFGSVNIKDLIMSILVAIGTPIFAGIGSLMNTGVIPNLANIKEFSVVGMAAGMAVLTHQFLSNSSGQLATKE